MFLFAEQLKANYESELFEKTAAIQELEIKLARADFRLKTMAQWKEKALEQMIKSDDPYAALNEKDHVLCLPTKVRLYRTLLRATAVKSYARNFRVNCNQQIL